MANEIFVDSSGFYALLVKRDDQHQAARRILKQAKRIRRGFVTTDYVLDETATLLKARGHSRILPQFFELISGSTACRLEWMDPERFATCEAYYLKHLDHRWSFTDCASFLVMRECRLQDALTKDVDFREVGFVPLLVD